MENELDLICKDLDAVLQTTLVTWSEALNEARETSGDPQALYCLYPKLVSHVSWARGTLQGAEASFAQIDQRRNMDLSQIKSAAMHSLAPGCCPCCGGACAPSACGGGPAGHTEGGQKEIHTETHIVRETTIEETSDGRSEEAGRARRRS
ncbi:MAG: hypothetical protein ABJO97_03690 [Roseibium sp.]|uniref:hypothetical protein n=1 Tax=Roseibium sp. TaxID=1936156 RepID=UPI0032678072